VLGCPPAPGPEVEHRLVPVQLRQLQPGVEVACHSEPRLFGVVGKLKVDVDTCLVVDAEALVQLDPALRLSRARLPPLVGGVEQRQPALDSMRQAAIRARERTGLQFAVIPRALCEGQRAAAGGTSEEVEELSTQRGLLANR
jgi:hypothetical protein